MAPAPPLKVVIADDSGPVADMLAELVAAAGPVEVVARAETGPATVEAIRTLRPDAVVLDLQLRTGSGTDVIREVRADPGLAGTQLLVTSNHASPELRAGCLALGADGYFDKVKELDGLGARLAALAAAKGE